MRTCAAALTVLMSLNLAGCGGYDAAQWGTRLHWAASDRGPSAIHREIAAGTPVDARDQQGVTPLMLAAGRHGSPDNMTALIDAGADVNAQDDRGFTALMLASTAWWSHAHGVFRPHQEVIERVQLLLQAGAKTELRNGDGAIALALAAAFGDPERIALLLDTGANIEARDNASLTPLMLAARSGGGNVACLVAAGANVDAQDDDGRTALMWAAHARSADSRVADDLHAGHANLEVTDSQGRTAVEHAAWFASTNTLAALLLELGASPVPAQWTPLMQAALKDDIIEVQRLLADGVDVNARDRSGRTALMWSARFVHLDGDAAIAAMLRAGADVNARDSQGMTALMLASSQAWLGEMDALIRAGADIDAADHNGRTALMHAAMTSTGEYKIELLLQHGSAVNVADGKGVTGLMFAAATADRQDTIDSLLNMGAHVGMRDATGRTALDYAEQDNDSVDRYWVIQRLRDASSDSQSGDR